MAESTEEKLVRAIELLTGNVQHYKADDALKYTQAALNLAHTMATLADIKRTKLLDLLSEQPEDTAK